MKRFLWCIVSTWVFLGLVPLCAQIPAQPVDPDQPRPAVPITPSTSAPQPAMPASNAAATPAPATPADITPEALTIIADSSLKQVLSELVQTWADSQDNSPKVPVTLTNASTLRAKIEGGNVYDVIISSDVQDMKDLTDKGLLAPDGQQSLARNTLVVYGRKALVKDDELEWFDLIGTEWKKVAMGNPDLTGSGRVAKRALQKHGLADEDHKNLFSYAVTDALAFAIVEREQADAVFIYKTDVPQPDLSGFTVYPIKTEDAPPIFYLAALSRLAKNPVPAHAFILFCSSEAAKPIWAKYGFETN